MVAKTDWVDNDGVTTPVAGVDRVAAVHLNALGSEVNLKADSLTDLGVTASAAELNTLDGVTASTAEINYTDGVTSAIQTQLDGKQPLDSDLTAWASKTAPTGTAVGTTDTQTLTNKTLTNPTINNYTEGVVAIGTVTTSNTISLTNGTVQTATLTASTACTFTMPSAVAGKSFVLLLKQAVTTGNGSATFTGVKWQTAGAPTITVTAGKMDILSFISDGTNWYGSYSQGYTP